MTKNSSDFVMNAQLFHYQFCHLLQVFSCEFMVILSVSSKRKVKIKEESKPRISRIWTLWVEYRNLDVTISLLKAEGLEAREKHK